MGGKPVAGDWLTVLGDILQSHTITKSGDVKYRKFQGKTRKFTQFLATGKHDTVSGKRRDPKSRRD